MPGAEPGGRSLADARERLRAALSRHVDGLVGSWGDSLLGVVLAGSVARGEDSWLQPGEGPAVLLSDVDLYAVAPEGIPLPPAPPPPPLLAGRLDLGRVGPGFFAGLAGKLPAHQLAAGLEVLHDSGGAWDRPDPELLVSTPIDPADATLLAHNRFAEQLSAGGPGRSVEGSWAAWKLWQDLPLAYLASWGQYDPSRSVQRERLGRLQRRLEPPAGAWLGRGLERLESMARSRAAGPLLPAELHGELGPAPASWPELVEWGWPFYRACLARAGGRSGAVASLAAAHAEGPPGPGDLARVRAWLGRESPWRRWRRARNWAPLGPVGLRPWWQHARAGVGPELAGAACALAFAGLDNGALMVAHGGAGEHGGSAAALAAWRGWRDREGA